ncbi:restriction endonuclease subunit S [Oribacterium sp. HCP3S3_B9]|uniref:restriction endonuclease subunit S n=1 Tax=unclassified Oribacterium TaxID=2629782 RepID=UPI003F8A146B
MAKLIEITGKALSGEWGTDDKTGDGIPVLRTTNFTNEGVVDYHNVVTRTIAKKNIEEKYLRLGDIIIEKSGGSDKQPVGRVIYFDGLENTYLFNNFTGLLRVKEPNLWFPKYVFYSLYGNYRRGGTRPFENKTTGLHNLKIDDYVSRYEVQDNSFERQIEISAHLDKLYSIIKMREEELIKFDELVKARFVEMFGDETNPYNWPVVNVEEVANVSVGVVIKPAQYYTNAEHGVKAFRSLNIGPMTIKDGDWVYFSREGNVKNAKSQLKENDLLIVRSGAPGTACVVPKQYEGCNAIDIIIARPNTERINPYYLCTYTNMPHGKRQIEEGTGGAAQQHFNVGKYNKLRLMLPPMDLQKEFVEFVAHVDKSKAAVQKSLDETQVLFDSLMQKYFG